MRNYYDEKQMLATEVVLQAHIGYTVKHIKELLQPVYFDVANKCLVVN